MASSWEHFGEIANVAQLTGIDAVRLIGMIVKAASTARMHKKNCKQFAQHLKLIGNLLEQLKISELKKYPETREPLEHLEDALRRSYILVNSCQDRSYLYLLAMGWNIVYQFRKAQNEIDRYLRIVPLITLVDNARVKVSNSPICCYLPLVILSLTLYTCSVVALCICCLPASRGLPCGFSASFWVFLYPERLCLILWNLWFIIFDLTL